MPTLTFTVYDGDEEYEVTIPALREKCDRCDGVGTHDPPEFSGGVSSDDFAEDPDFAEMYMARVYDVPCEQCHGERIVLVPDREHADPIDLEKWDDKQQYEAECRAERRHQQRYQY